MADGKFTKGHQPWHKGTKGLIKNQLKGKAMPEEWKEKLRKPKSVKPIYSAERNRKISEAMSKKIGHLSNNWKGGGAHLKHNHIRRSRIKSNGGSHTNREWETLKAQYNWICLDCKVQEPNIKLTRDHIIPVSKGGSDNIENIQPLCEKCNYHKFTKVIKYDHGR